MAIYKMQEDYWLMQHLCLLMNTVDAFPIFYVVFCDGSREDNNEWYDILPFKHG